MSDCSETDGASITRHKEGPIAWVTVSRPGLREFYVTCTPHDTIGTNDVTAQSREVYHALASWSGECQAIGIQERIFGSLAHREAILAEREAFLFGESDLRLWPATFVQGAPCDPDGLAGLHLYGVAGPRCSPIHHDQHLCGVAFEHHDARHVYLTGLCGPPTMANRPEEAKAMFARTQEILLASGASYADVVRTWIYLADIIDWYHEFNPVRSTLYAQFQAMDPTGSAWPPASTGIEAQLPAGACCLMDLFALGGPGRKEVSVEPVHNPRQSEAYSYGSGFSRGMAVTFDGVETVYVSGTAAINEKGQSVCIDDLSGQVSYTLDNIASLLNTRYMTLDDFVSSTIFIKQGYDTELVREFIDDRSGCLANGVYVTADVCRPELLCEIDGIAVRASD